MPYAKTSLRAEQRALREQMRALGMSHRPIAVEFARRYNPRPRAAWRHAHGWSLKEAAEDINTYAAHHGLHPDGATVAMTGPHLCEHEHSAVHVDRGRASRLPTCCLLPERGGRRVRACLAGTCLPLRKALCGSSSG